MVYIVLYGSFSAYPIIFAAHGLSPKMIGLTFLPVTFGFIFLLGGTFLHYLRYKRLARDAEKGLERRGIWKGKVEPEERLIPRKQSLQESYFSDVQDDGHIIVLVAGILFPAGLFWLAWTSPAKYSVWLTMMRYSFT